MVAASKTYRECGNYVVLSNPETTTSTAKSATMWTVDVSEIKYAYFSMDVATNDVDVEILGSVDGTTYPVSVLASHTVSVGDASHVESFTNTGIRFLQFNIIDTVGGNHGDIDIWAVLRSM